MNCKAFLLAVGLAQALLCQSPKALFAESRPGAVEFILRAKKPAFTLHEPLWAELLIRNSTASPFAVDLGEDCQGNIQLVITAPDSSRTDLRIPRSPEGGFDSECRVVVKAGSEYSRGMLLNKWFNSWNVGLYDVVLRVEGESGEFYAPNLKIHLVARDPVVLGKICLTLESAALSPQSEIALEASEALGFIVDDACLPSLKRVLGGSFYGQEAAVKGIARLGTNEADGVLADAWKNLDQGQRSLAVSELTRNGHLKSFDAALAKIGLSRLQ